MYSWMWQLSIVHSALPTFLLYWYSEESHLLELTTIFALLSVNYTIQSRTYPLSTHIFSTSCAHTFLYYKESLFHIWLTPVVQSPKDKMVGATDRSLKLHYLIIYNFTPKKLLQCISYTILTIINVLNNWLRCDVIDKLII